MLSTEQIVRIVRKASADKKIALDGIELPAELLNILDSSPDSGTLAKENSSEKLEDK